MGPRPHDSITPANKSLLSESRYLLQRQRTENVRPSPLTGLDSHLAHNQGRTEIDLTADATDQQSISNTYDSVSRPSRRINTTLEEYRQVTEQQQFCEPRNRKRISRSRTYPAECPAAGSSQTHVSPYLENKPLRQTEHGSLFHSDIDSIQSPAPSTPGLHPGHKNLARQNLASRNSSPDELNNDTPPLRTLVNNPTSLVVPRFIDRSNNFTELDIKPKSHASKHKFGSQYTISSCTRKSIRIVCACSGYDILNTEAIFCYTFDDRKKALVLMQQKAHSIQPFALATGHKWLDLDFAMIHRVYCRSDQSPYIKIYRPESGRIGSELWLQFEDLRSVALFETWIKSACRTSEHIIDVGRAGDWLKGGFENAILDASRARTRRNANGGIETAHGSECSMAEKANREEVSEKTGVKEAEKWERAERAETAEGGRKIEGAERAVRENAHAHIQNGHRQFVRGSRITRSVTANSEFISVASRIQPPPGSPKLIANDSPPAAELEVPMLTWTRQHPDWKQSWKNSLVFPPAGRNRQTVDQMDICRLDEGEFLNDNLINFYLRYMEYELEKTRPDLLTRVHIMNSFFYESLTLNRRRNMNFEDVNKWTSKIKLFDYDYIIIPVNEHLHWYLAVICKPAGVMPRSMHSNLDPNAVKSDRPSSLMRGIDAIADAPIAGISSPKSICDFQAADNSVFEKTPTIKANADETYNTPVEIQDDDESRWPGSLTSEDEPSKFCIVTLDSLDKSHSPTCTHLKEFVMHEAKCRTGFEIPSPGSIGVTAKMIPLQSNHCDCGLFLLGYVQAFLSNPDDFMARIVQREKPNWTVQPSDLRHEIREVAFRLQNEQRDRLAQEDRQNPKKRRPPNTPALAAHEPALNIQGSFSQQMTPTTSPGAIAAFKSEPAVVPSSHHRRVTENLERGQGDKAEKRQESEGNDRKRLKVEADQQPQKEEVGKSPGLLVQLLEDDRGSKMGSPSKLSAKIMFPIKTSLPTMENRSNPCQSVSTLDLDLKSEKLDSSPTEDISQPLPRSVQCEGTALALLGSTSVPSATRVDDYISNGQKTAKIIPRSAWSVVLGPVL